MMLARHALVLAVALATIPPALAHAKDGEDDSHHSIAVPAAGCSELPSAVGAPSARAGGAFTVAGGATASLLCPLPSDELGHSSGSGSAKSVSFQVAYLDSDGPGAALVAVELVQTTLAADPDGFTDTVVCAWNSAAGGPVTGATASFAYNDLVEGAFYHLRVGLASTPGSAASFVGVVAHR